ncbi:MAG: diaminopimelate decarboxylase family protein [Myxococcaceae bacterium]
MKSSLKRLLAPAVRAGSPARVDLPPSLWGCSVSGAQHLTFDGVDLPSLLDRWGSPLQVVLSANLEQNVRAFASAPGLEVFYSYKTNPVPGVLRQLHALGVGAEVISPFELWLARKLGVPPERTIYNGPAKSPESLSQAIGDGLLLINLNSREEVAIAARVARARGRRARVGLRVSTRLGWAAQFGLPIASGQAFAAFREALASPDLEVVGLHAHVGALIRSRAFHSAFLAEVLAFTDELRQRLGLELRILDLGGSLALPSVAAFDPVARRLNRAFLCDLPAPDPADSLSICDFVQSLSGQVQQHYARRRLAPPRIFLEPGRSLTGNGQLLLCRVLAVKASVEPPTYAVLDAGINLAEAARSEFHQLFAAGKLGLPHDQPYRLVGPICSPGDVLYDGWRLPRLEPGDALAVMDSGAYFVPFETSFSFPRPAVVRLAAGREELLRRRETFEDMAARDAGFWA